LCARIAYLAVYDGRSASPLDRVRTIHAIALLSTIGALNIPAFAEPPNPVVPSGFISLTVCAANLTGEACATLNKGSVLKVEDRRGQELLRVIYDDKLAPEVTGQLFARVQSFIRSFPGSSRNTYVTDSLRLTVSLNFIGGEAEVRVDGIASASDAGPEADALIKLLHDIVPDESRFH
jgi:hypothetical protein